ncbi:MAG: glycosyltransferase family 2 protein [Bacilli bacterium]|nr:glycosyltransferase family 2 protein [Bacilli bacterium]
MDKISIIVPVYNSEKFLDKCIQSVLNQSYQNFELVLVNDGSTDNSLSIIEKYTKDNRIKLINKKNSGVSDTRNVGIEVATGDLIMFLDSDDYFEENYLYEMITELNNNNCELVISGLTYRDENYKLLKKQLYTNKTKKINFNDIILDMINTLYFSSCYKMLFKKSFLEEKNIKFDKNLKYGEDTMFAYNLLKNCSSIFYINSTGYNYVQNSSSVLHKNDLNSIIKYMDDSIFLLSNFEEDIEDQYIIPNRILTKYNICLKKLCINKDFTFKKFKDINNELTKKYNIFNNIELDKINYESRANLLLIKLLTKKHLMLYYYLVKAKKIISNI